MSELGKIPEAAKLEAVKASPATLPGEAALGEPDLSSIPSDKMEEWVRKLYILELQRRLAEDKSMSALRGKYADRIFYLTVTWLFIVVILVVFSGISLPERRGFGAGISQIKFQLSEAVLIAFISTTTINVIALFLAVTAWLFPKDSAIHIEPEKLKPVSGG